MSGGKDPDEVYPDFHEVKKILVDAGMDPGEAWDKAGFYGGWSIEQARAWAAEHGKGESQ